ncbi:MAG: hypothetical protein PHH26_02485 [Candidatus Thermoplasmatota archaeon]|nr:hypothetical protein [Candidatus Thermoplasmatota archaeon]
MKIVLNRVFILLCFVVAAGLISVVACSSNNNQVNPVGTGGSGATAQGGAGGSQVEAGIGGTSGIAGSSGSAGQSDSGLDGTAGTTGSWPKGAGYGHVDSITHLINGAGSLVNLTHRSGQKTMDYTPSGNDPLDAGDGAGAPNTVPTIKSDQVKSEIWMPIIPYFSSPDLVDTYPPLVVIAKPNEVPVVLQPFTVAEAETEFSLTSPYVGKTVWSPHTVMVNGQKLAALTGLDMSLVHCSVGGGPVRHFLTSNGADKIFELFEDGTRQTLVSGLIAPSQMLCHPDGYLLVTTLPIWGCAYPEESVFGCENTGLKTPAKILKVTLDGTISEFATLPFDLKYPANQIPLSNWLRTTTDLMPQGWRYPMALKPDNSIVVGDQAGLAIMHVSGDGQTVEKVADMPALTSSAILAPNGFIYVISNMLMQEDGKTILTPPSIQVLDNDQWTTLQEIDGYQPFTDYLTSYMVGAPCAAQDGGLCLEPIGVLECIDFDDQNNLCIASSVKGSLDCFHLSFLEVADN